MGPFGTINQGALVCINESRRWKLTSEVESEATPSHKDECVQENEAQWRSRRTEKCRRDLLGRECGKVGVVVCDRKGD